MRHCCRSAAPFQPVDSDVLWQPTSHTWADQIALLNSFKPNSPAKPATDWLTVDNLKFHRQIAQFISHLRWRTDGLPPSPQSSANNYCVCPQVLQRLYCTFQSNSISNLHPSMSASATQCLLLFNVSIRVDRQSSRNSRRRRAWPEETPDPVLLFTES